MSSPFVAESFCSLHTTFVYFSAYTADYIYSIRSYVLYGCLYDTHITHYIHIAFLSFLLHSICTLRMINDATYTNSRTKLLISFVAIQSKNITLFTHRTPPVCVPFVCMADGFLQQTFFEILIRKAVFFHQISCLHIENMVVWLNGQWRSYDHSSNQIFVSIESNNSKFLLQLN